MSATRVLLLLILMGSPASVAQVVVTRTDPVVQRNSFDPKNPPADMPKLAANESAKTRTYFGVDANVRGSVITREAIESGQKVTMRIDSIRMTLKLEVSIWTPRNAVPKIINHEEGHWQIARHFYSSGEAVARQVAEQMIGHTVTGTGADYESAARNALQDAVHTVCRLYLDYTDVPAGKAHEYYDQVTAHGTNAVREERGVRESIERAERETPQAATMPATRPG